MTKHNTPQQEFYTKIKHLNSGIREKGVVFRRKLQHKPWVKGSNYKINAYIPRNNKRKTNKQEGETTW